MGELLDERVRTEAWITDRHENLTEKLVQSREEQVRKEQGL